MTIQIEERTTFVTRLQHRRQAHELLEQVGGPADAMTVGAQNHMVPVPSELVDVVAHVLSAVAEGRTLVIGSLPDELTTTVAAEQLGVSRPTLMRMIRDEEIPAHKVGTHHRVKTADVMAFRRDRIARQRRELEELLDLESELEQF